MLQLSYPGSLVSVRPLDVLQAEMLLVVSRVRLSRVRPSCRAIVALVYNVLKAFMEMNSTLFDELTATYKSDRQR